MSPKDLLDYLENTLDAQALRRLDPPSLHRLENLLHHWYVLTGDLRRDKLRQATASPLERARRPAPAFNLTPPGLDEHAHHLGAI